MAHIVKCCGHAHSVYLTLWVSDTPLRPLSCPRGTAIADKRRAKRLSEREVVDPHTRLTRDGLV